MLRNPHRLSHHRSCIPHPAPPLKNCRMMQKSTAMCCNTSGHMSLFNIFVIVEQWQTWKNGKYTIILYRGRTHVLKQSKFNYVHAGSRICTATYKLAVQSFCPLAYAVSWQTPVSGRRDLATLHTCLVLAGNLAVGTLQSGKSSKFVRLIHFALAIHHSDQIFAAYLK